MRRSTPARARSSVCRSAPGRGRGTGSSSAAKPLNPCLPACLPASNLPGGAVTQRTTTTLILSLRIETTWGRSVGRSVTGGRRCRGHPRPDPPPPLRVGDRREGDDNTLDPKSKTPRRRGVHCVDFTRKCAQPRSIPYVNPICTCISTYIGRRLCGNAKIDWASQKTNSCGENGLKVTCY